MSEITAEQEFEALLDAFSEDLGRINRDIQSSGRRSYRVDGAHVMVGPTEPVSDEYLASHGLSRGGTTV